MNDYEKKSVAEFIKSVQISEDFYNSELKLLVEEFLFIKGKNTDS